jgi:hypothetical protein
MQTLNIHTLEARYRLPRSAGPVRERLDRTLAQVVENALDQLNLPEEALVCIQTLYVQVRLRLSQTDAALVQAWAQMLAEAIGRAARGGQVAGVAYYPSRRQALGDFAASVAREEWTQAWVWKQLGFCCSSQPPGDAEAVRELVRILADEPTVVVPILCGLEDAGLLGRLAPRLSVAQWTALVDAVLGNRSWRTVPAGATPEAVPQTTPREEAARTLPRQPAQIVRLARRLVACSRLTDTFRQLPPDSAERDRALAVLLVFATDPALLARPKMAAPLVIAVGRWLRSGAAALADLSPHREKEQGPQTTWREATRPGRERGKEDAADRVHTPRSLASPRSETKDLPPGDTRPRALTRFGGLLYLCGVIADESLPEEMAQQAAETGRTVRWFLHGLALHLVPATPDDAAALAFAGLGPDAEPPSADGDPPTEAEAELVAGFAGRVVAHLRDRFQRPEQPDADLVDFICRRRAEIVADPGWIEVRLATEEVSTEIRRAGLDLDPGYLPYLGVVLKFRYE